MPALQLEGKKFGKLTVLERRPAKKGYNIRWLVLCSCGRKKIVGGASLVTGGTVTCAQCPRGRDKRSPIIKSKLSQQEIAKKAGITAGALSTILSGNRRWRALETAAAIAKAANITLDQLYRSLSKLWPK